MPSQKTLSCGPEEDKVMELMLHDVFTIFKMIDIETRIFCRKI